jgi:hypothetical protein
MLDFHIPSDAVYLTIYSLLDRTNTPVVNVHASCKALYPVDIKLLGPCGISAVPVQ